MVGYASFSLPWVFLGLAHACGDISGSTEYGVLVYMIDSLLEVSLLSCFGVGLLGTVLVVMHVSLQVSN